MTRQIQTVGDELAKWLHVSPDGRIYLYPSPAPDFKEWGNENHLKAFISLVEEKLAQAEARGADTAREDERNRTVQLIHKIAVLGTYDHTGREIKLLDIVIEALLKGEACRMNHKLDAIGVKPCIALAKKKPILEMQSLTGKWSPICKYHLELKQRNLDNNPWGGLFDIKTRELEAKEHHAS